MLSCRCGGQRNKVTRTHTVSETVKLVVHQELDVVRVIPGLRGSPAALRFSDRRRGSTLLLRAALHFGCGVRCWPLAAAPVALFPADFLVPGISLKSFKNLQGRYSYYQ